MQENILYVSTEEYATMTRAVSEVCPYDGTDPTVVALRSIGMLDRDINSLVERYGYKGNGQGIQVIVQEFIKEFG